MFSNTVYGGKESQWLIAFYGFGQSAGIFKPLYELIQETHNLLVVNLPEEDYTMDIYPKDLKEYLTPVLHKEGIHSFQTVSFSMGSRFNLFMPEYFPRNVSKMILVAPDGIKINVWNRIAAHTSLGQRLFRFFVKSKNAYLNLLSLLYRTRILSKSLYTFSKWNMRDKTQRTKVYNAWMNMRYIQPNLKEVNELIQDNGIELITYFGMKDAVIPLHIYKKCKRVFPKGRHNLIDADHNIMNKEFFTILAHEIKK